MIKLMKCAMCCFQHYKRLILSVSAAAAREDAALIGSFQKTASPLQ